MDMSQMHCAEWDRKCEVWAAQSCPTLCDPMDCSLPGSSVHRILWARILEGVAIPFSRGSSPPRAQTPYTAGRFFTIWATREAHEWSLTQKLHSIWFQNRSGGVDTRWMWGSIEKSVVRRSSCIRLHFAPAGTVWTDLWMPDCPMPLAENQGCGSPGMSSRDRWGTLRYSVTHSLSRARIWFLGEFSTTTGVRGLERPQSPKISCSRETCFPKLGLS